MVGVGRKCPRVSILMATGSNGGETFGIAHDLSYQLQHLLEGRSPTRDACFTSAATKKAIVAEKVTSVVELWCLLLCLFVRGIGGSHHCSQ